MTSPHKNESPQSKSGWQSLLILIVVAVILRWQVIEPRWIPSGSMLPTLKIQDRILVEKVSPKVQKLSQSIFRLEEIIVFKPPNRLIEAGYESKTALIKRIVGLPGDQIEVHNGQLIRNGSLIKESWLAEPINYEMSRVIVPPKTYWVLGDNRNNSLDSHFWGALPEENIIGTAILRYWPLNKISLFGSLSLRNYVDKTLMR